MQWEIKVFSNLQMQDINWIKLLTTITMEFIRDILLTLKEGWTVGSSGISKTTNGGTNWIFRSNISVFSNSLIDVYFIDENTGWCITNNGIILKSTNGGDNWSLLYSDSTKHTKQSLFCDL